MKKNVFLLLLASMLSAQMVNAQSVTITPASAEICEGSGDFVTLQAVPSGGIVLSYLWSSGQTSSTINVSPGSTTTYTVTATFLGGIIRTASATITVLPALVSTITPSGPTTICDGDDVELVADLADSWQWYLDGSPIFGATDQTYIASVEGSYTVLITSGSCSTMSDPIVVTVIPLPVAIVTPDGPLYLCHSTTTLLTATLVSGATYQWQQSDDGGLTDTWTNIGGEINQTYNAGATGYYRVRVTVSGCINYSN